MKKFDIVCLGSITVDTFINPPETHICTVGHKDYLGFELGQKIGLKDIFIACGGGAANTAVGFARMGLKATAIGVIGDDEEGHYIRKTLERHGISADYLLIEEGEHSSFSIILSPAEDGRRVVLHRTAQSHKFNRKTIWDCPDTRAIYISHLYGGAEELFSELPAWKAKHPDTLVGWNPGKTQFEAGMKAFSSVWEHIDLLILNTEEAELFTGLQVKHFAPEAIMNESVRGKTVEVGESLEIKSIPDVRDMAKLFLRAGVKTVLITDGQNGAQGFNQAGEHCFLPTKKGPCISTLGAGDAFSVGAICAYLEQKSLSDQMLWGTLSGYFVVQEFGAQEGQMTREKLESVLEK